MADPVHAVLLAAGEGSRLRPLTDRVPKPLLPIDGRAVIDTMLDELARLGVDSHTIITGYLGETLRQHVSSTRPDLTPRWVDQPERLGSAHALQLALAAGMPPRDAIVCATDTVWRSDDLRRVVTAFHESRPMVVMGLRRWPVEQLPGRSCVNVDEATGHVQRVMEKPAPEAITSAMSGSPFYVFRADFWPYVAAVESPEGISYELALGLQAAIDDGHTVLGVEVTDTRDITTPFDLLCHNFPYLQRVLGP